MSAAPGGAGAPPAPLPLARVPAQLRPALDDERLARAAWSRLAEPGDAAAAALVTEVGARAALEAVLAGAGPRRWRTRLADVDPVADLARLHRCGGRLLVPGDAQWPRALADLTVAGAGAPFCLWVRGPLDLAAAADRGAAVVGSRAATGYGEHVTAEIAGGLAERRFCIWSGGAHGIDAAAHRAALAVGGASVAVLACGVDRAYPRANARLLAALAERGAVVSEVPPGSAPTRWRFLERNRLIAAAARGTVVVEAAWRSGALSTADRALALLRPVGAVPGPVTSAASAGCHRLLRERAAVCVTDAAEAAELLGGAGEHLPGAREVAPRPLDALAGPERRVVEALPLRGALPTEALARAAGLDVPTVQAALGRLQLADLVREGASGWQLSTALARQLDPAGR